jgi:hypothetical protein
MRSCQGGGLVSIVARSWTCTRTACLEPEYNAQQREKPSIPRYRCTGIAIPVYGHTGTWYTLRDPLLFYRCAGWLQRSIRLPSPNIFRYFVYWRILGASKPNAGRHGPACRTDGTNALSRPAARRRPHGSLGCSCAPATSRFLRVLLCFPDAASLTAMVRGQAAQNASTCRQCGASTRHS